MSTFRSTQFLVACLFCFVFLSYARANAALAPLPSNECELSGSTASCYSAGYIDNNGASNSSAYFLANGITPSPFLGARTTANTTAAVATDVWGTCWYIDNASSSSYFVPFKTAGEWQSFYKAVNAGTLSGVTLTHCSRPQTGLTINPSSACVSPSPVSTTVNEPNYYRWTSSAPTFLKTTTFTCNPSNPGGGGSWTETATATFSGLNGETEGADLKTWTDNNTSWSAPLMSYTATASSCDKAISLLNVTTAPTSNLCATGIASPVTQSPTAIDEWSWTCTTGQPPTASQLCTTTVDGVCGVSSGVCSAGSSSGKSDNGTTTTWSCVGVKGTTASCSVNDPVNGSCGSTSGTCSPGAVQNTTDNGTTTTWTCAGLYGGTSTSCSATDPVNGACSGSMAQCTSGAVQGVSNNGTTTTWSCVGSHGGTTTSCSANDPINGSCGASAGACSFGTVSGESNNGTMTDWTCAGSYGGSSASCSIYDPVNGSCGGSTGACSTGSASGTNNNGTTTTWSCAGSYGGSTMSCSVNDPINGVCSSSTGACGAGNASATSNNGSTTSWTCSGSNGGTTASCSVNDPINGACSATTGACSTGSASGTSVSGYTTTWSCAGSYGGTTASCSYTVTQPQCSSETDGCTGCDVGTSSSCTSSRKTSGKFFWTAYSWTCSVGSVSTSCSASSCVSESGVYDCE